MTLDDIKKRIGERVDDDEATAYAARYEGIFVDAISTAVKAVDENGNPLFSPSEYPELVTPFEKQVTFSDKFAEVSYIELESPIMIRDVYSDPIHVSEVNRINFQKRTLPQMLIIRSNEHLIPDMNEGYWHPKADSIIMLSGTLKRSDLVTFDVVENPKSSNWGTDDLETDHGYGRAFLEACIKISADTLLREIGLERR